MAELATEADRDSVETLEKAIEEDQERKEREERQERRNKTKYGGQIDGEIER